MQTHTTKAGQAESISKQEKLFETKSPNWISWEDANKARQACIQKYNAAKGDEKKTLLRDCMILAFCSHVRQLQSGWVSQADIFANTGDEPMLQSESPPAGCCC